MSPLGCMLGAHRILIEVRVFSWWCLKTDSSRTGHLVGHRVECRQVWEGPGAYPWERGDETRRRWELVNPWPKS